MIQFCNNEINEVHYNGYTIEKIYACGGELVYDVAPEPPIPSCDNYLTFIAQEDGTFKFSGTSGNSSIQYSLDSGSTWNTLSSGVDSPTVQSGGTIMWKGNLIPTEHDYGDGGIGTFLSSNRFEAEGNIMSLLYGDNYRGKTSLEGKSNAFVLLFKYCTGLTSAENLCLPAIRLEHGCYSNMFLECENLVTPPSILPATSLPYSCYSTMFGGCRSLTRTPTLLATDLNEDCYYEMFAGCINLTTITSPLSATTLYKQCYKRMFSNCKSLTTAPALPATTLAMRCYEDMFFGCSGLTTAPVLSAETLVEGCYDSMFEECTSLSGVTCLATDISAVNCTSRWLYNVANNGTFTKAASMNDWTSGNDGIPSGWTVVGA